MFIGFAKWIRVAKTVSVGLAMLSAVTACSSNEADAGGGQGVGGQPDGEFPTYIYPSRVCRAPLPGEPAGNSDGGQVCTMQAVAAATEEGRRFGDYADCEVVRTQRPYYPMPPHDLYRAEQDPLLQDDAYVSELAWVTAQLAAQGCSCCHSADAPDGPVRFSIDAPGNWVGMMSDRDTAGMLAWYDVSMLDVWPAEENNGFSRVYGMPSTDSERSYRFFADEASRRGLSKEQFATAPPTASRLVEQRDYEPGRCAPGVGVSRDGTVTWTGTPARYLWILEAGSANPTQVPDRDTPVGTLWRIDVPPEGLPLFSGSLKAGQTPQGVLQRVPVDQPMAPLQSGKDYYLYVDTDFFVPTTRCIFTY